MATRKRDTEQEQDRPRADAAHAAAIAARAEVVEILATAVFAILLEGRAPTSNLDRTEQQGECS